jgi:hypothetical protein
MLASDLEASTMKRRVGIYLRVSTDGQTTENQRRWPEFTMRMNWSTGMLISVSKVRDWPSALTHGMNVAGPTAVQLGAIH